MDPKGVPWSFLGVIWGPLGDFLGSLDVLLAAVGSPWAPLGRFPGFSGKFREAFWLHFELIFGVFCALCLGFVF